MAKGKTKTVDWELLDKILKFKCTSKDAEDILGISHDTIERNIRKKYDLTFSQYREKKMAGTRFKLQHKAINMALKGNVPMMIFCLKNLCKWVDTPEPSQDDNFELEFVDK